MGHNLGEDGTLSVARLWKGPRWAEVRAVDESEAPLEQNQGFFIRH